MTLYNSYKLNAQSKIEYKEKIQNERQGALVRCTRAYLDPKLIG
jgi:hypothetical protein